MNGRGRMNRKQRDKWIKFELRKKEYMNDQKRIRMIREPIKWDEGRCRMIRKERDG